MIGLKNLGLLKHIFILFWCYFHLNSKELALAVSRLTVTLKMMDGSQDHSANDDWQQRISTSDQCSLADRSSWQKVPYFSNGRNLKKVCGDHPVSHITLESFTRGVTYLFKNETSPTSIEENDFHLLLIICKVTVKWESAKACFFKDIKHENDVKMS